MGSKPRKGSKIIETNFGYSGKTISSGTELLDYYTWLLSYLCNIEHREERAREVINVRKLIEEK